MTDMQQVMLGVVVISVLLMIVAGRLFIQIHRRTDTKEREIRNWMHFVNSLAFDERTADNVDRRLFGEKPKRKRKNQDNLLTDDGELREDFDG